MSISSPDFIVIGSGLAGLNAALKLATLGEVLIITKAKIQDSATICAQGGIAAVIGKKDSIRQHIEDTLTAGCYHNDRQAVSFMIKQSKAAIKRLRDLGVRFDRRGGKLALGLEAAHSSARIVHATDLTGKEIEKTLIKRVGERKNITVWEETVAIKLLVDQNGCFGVKVLGKNGNPTNLYADSVILASGGAGQLYQWTTNPRVATGDGIALAHQVGAEMVDLEFVQFHPTALKYGYSPLFLLSEALRGEGAILVNEQGKRFMQKIKGKELAPRDVVARAIWREQKKGEVYLDIRHQDAKTIKKRFPNIYKELKKRGFDLTSDLLPVTPAAHFLCGGVKTNCLGQTTISNLLAYGEVACTGVHGANRLASNSLLEAIVFSNQVKDAVADKRHGHEEPLSSRHPEKLRAIKNPRQIQNFQPDSSSKGHLIQSGYRDSKAIISQKSYQTLRQKIQQLMWENVGILRTKEGLTKAVKELSKIAQECLKINVSNRETAELKMMSITACLIAQAAKKRPGSLGAHFLGRG